MIAAVDRAHVQARLAFYARHLCLDVLPWWLDNAIDEAHGGVFTYWDGSGRTLTLRSRDKYVWSQGRWGWTMAMLARLADARPDLGLDAGRLRRSAMQTATLLLDAAVLPDGTCCSVIGDDGRPVARAPGLALHDSVYADLFVALAFVGAETVEPGHGWGLQALRLLVAADDRIAAGTARTEPYVVPAGFESFALQMILLNTATEVFAATRAPEAVRVATAAAAAIRHRFSTGGDICELRPLADGLDDTLDARHRNPGHAIEALWMYLQAAERMPAVAAVDPDFLAWLVASFRHLAGIGWDTAEGGLLRFADRDGGKPRGRSSGLAYDAMVQASWDWKLWWPHNEALYTALLLWLRSGDAEVARWYRRIDDYVFARFPAGPGLEWNQILDRRGNPMAPDAGAALPVKDPYHLLRCLLLLLELAPELDAKPERNSHDQGIASP